MWIIFCKYYNKKQQRKNFFISFFFFRNKNNIGDIGKLITNIIIQLAQFLILLKKIHKGVIDNKKIAKKFLQDQWKQLILKPISKLDIELFCTILVFVIDTLDECDKQGNIWQVFYLLANAKALQTVWLYALIISKSEINTQYNFSKILQNIY